MVSCVYVVGVGVGFTFRFNESSFCVQIRRGEIGEVRFLINMANCCVVLVEILKCSHRFGERDVCAPVGGYG